MKTIQVAASRPYEVHIGQGILCRLGTAASQVIRGRKAAIVSDETVWVLYGEAAQASFEEAGFSVCSFVFSPGESRKNSVTFLNILNFLAENRLTRTDCLVALGGGVVGDVAGFAAACYLRGIPYIQVPTSLLAMVDSSVGGKTAIDLPGGKNLCGAFYQPWFVLCDTDTLGTLPKEEFRAGCAEVLKYGVLFDPMLFAHLQEKGLDFDREWVISRCVSCKAQTVGQDEYDTGVRRLLNLGHTIGHAIEAESGFGISHGNAVAIGMAMAAKASQKLGYCRENTVHSLLSSLNALGLPCCADFSAEALHRHALADKKAQGDKLHVILPQEIGCCQIVPMDMAQLLEFIKAGL